MLMVRVRRDLLQDGAVPPHRIEQVLRTIGRNTRLQARPTDNLLDASPCW
jgi:hypothetical protein